MIFILILSILGILYAYFGYPLSMIFLSLFIKKKIKKDTFTPPLTLIITAHNEGKRIREKLENTLKIEYPKERLQVIIASDGSTDDTNQIVAEYANKGIVLLDVKDRGGKENAQKEAVAYATGDILIFSDAATLLDPQGILAMTSNFADPSVGCVSSEDKMITTKGNSSGEGFYVRYEMWMRSIETQVNTLVQLSGSFFGARKEVCQDFSTKMTSDFRTLLNSMRLGMRGVIEPGAVGYYKDIQDASREFTRKSRTIIRGLTVFFNNLEFLNIFKYGLFTYQYISHKLCRWLVPFFLIGAFVSNVALFSTHMICTVLCIGQILFYCAALIGLIFPKSGKWIFIKIPRFFTIANASILVAWTRFLRGERLTMWNPSVR